MGRRATWLCDGPVCRASVTTFVEWGQRHSVLHTVLLQKPDGLALSARETTRKSNGRTTVCLCVLPHPKIILLNAHSCLKRRPDGDCMVERGTKALRGLSNLPQGKGNKMGRYWPPLGVITSPDSKCWGWYLNPRIWTPELVLFLFKSFREGKALDKNGLIILPAFSSGVTWPFRPLGGNVRRLCAAYWLYDLGQDTPSPSVPICKMELIDRPMSLLWVFRGDKCY